MKPEQSGFFVFTGIFLNNDEILVKRQQELL